MGVSVKRIMAGRTAFLPRSAFELGWILSRQMKADSVFGVRMHDTRPVVAKNLTLNGNPHTAIGLLVVF